MAVSITTITNKSVQVVPLLINSTTADGVSASSDLVYTKSEQLGLQPGAQLVVETARVDAGQLEQLQRMGLISVT
jgi:hypothetical protein